MCYFIVFTGIVNLLLKLLTEHIINIYNKSFTYGLLCQTYRSKVNDSIVTKLFQYKDSKHYSHKEKGIMFTLT